MFMSMTVQRHKLLQLNLGAHGTVHLMTTLTMIMMMMMMMTTTTTTKTSTSKAHMMQVENIGRKTETRRIESGPYRYICRVNSNALKSYTRNIPAILQHELFKSVPI
jgi:hypothetical protein